MDTFKDLMTVVTYGIEGFGVLVIVVGCFAGTVTFLRQLGGAERGSAYETYRLRVGRSMILGLEFLIAGDVIRTVIVSHTLASVGVLALVVLIRAFLSFTLVLEVEGRWPWQREQTAETG